MTAAFSFRRNLPLFVFVGAICFFTGRFSAPKNNSAANPKILAPQNSAANTTAIKKSAAAAVQFIPITTASAEWNEKLWQQLLSQPATPDRNAALAAMLEKLAMTDPKRAMALAQAEKNLNFRKTL